MNQGRFQRRRVAPTVAKALGLRRLQRMPKANAGVCDRDHDHTARQLAPPVVRLHRHPAAGARVLHNILTRLRKRHSESHRRFRIESQLRAEDCRRALLDRAHHRVHILGGAHGRHGQEHVTLHRRSCLRHLAVDLEQVRRFAKEAGARPVAHHVGIRRRGQQRPLALVRSSLPGREQAHQSIGRCPLGCMCVEQQALPVPRLRVRRGELVKRAVVELRRHFDEPRHATESLPMR